MGSEMCIRDRCACSEHTHGHEWPVDGPNPLGFRHAKDAGATMQIEGHAQTGNVKVKATDVGASFCT